MYLSNHQEWVIKLRAFFLHHSASFPRLISKSLQGKCRIYLFLDHLTWLWTCHTILCCPQRVRFLTHFYRISWMTAHGWLEAIKRIWQRIKHPLLTAVHYSLARGHFHAVLSGLFLYMSTCKAVSMGKLQDKDIQFSHIIWWFFKDIIVKGEYWTEFVVYTLSLKEMVILCIFVLLYRYFVIKTRWNAKNDHISCWGTFSFFNWDGEC